MTYFLARPFARLTLLSDWISAGGFRRRKVCDADRVGSLFTHYGEFDVSNSSLELVSIFSLLRCPMPFDQMADILIFCRYFFMWALDSLLRLEGWLDSWLPHIHSYEITWKLLKASNTRSLLIDASRKSGSEIKRILLWYILIFRHWLILIHTRAFRIILFLVLVLLRIHLLKLCIILWSIEDLNEWPDLSLYSQIKLFVSCFEGILEAQSLTELGNAVQI
jgi:hypothetical protein